MLARKLGSQGIRVSSQGSKLSIHERRHYSPSRLKSGVGSGGMLGSDFKALRVTTSVGSFTVFKRVALDQAKTILEITRNRNDPLVSCGFVDHSYPKGRKHEINYERPLEDQISRTAIME